MADALSDFKAQARLLHRAALANDPDALARVRAAEPDALQTGVLRRHCLSALARELGFSRWPHASQVLSGAPVDDFGTLLYPHGGAAHTNVWVASYEKARAIHQQTGGYLLAYRRQFFIADRYFVELLGVSPDDPDWERIGFDWARPTDPAARQRLYARVIRGRAAP